MIKTQMKKIDIIVTLTASNCRRDNIVKYQRAGMSIARLNASHLNLSQIQEMRLTLTKASPATLIMLDLPGPEYRIFGYEKPFSVQVDDILEITNSPFPQGLEVAGVYTNYLEFDNIAKPEVTFMNGELKALIKEVKGSTIAVQFINSGVLRPNAHIMFCGSGSDLPYLSNWDRELLAYAIQSKVDMIALSFVQSPSDLNQIYKYLDAAVTIHRPKIVLKFETKAALSNMDDLIQGADAFFVARGDLALSIDPLTIPLVQKDIISRCNKADKPVYVATQILSSMVYNPYPLRAEVSDLANAVLDGCDGITLSEETAIGSYPVEAIQTSKEIIANVQNRVLPYKTNVQWDPWQILLQQPGFLALIKSVSDIGERIWQRGMAEANAGNLSINITDFVKEIHVEDVKTMEHWYLVSKTGSRYRGFKNDPRQNLLIINTDGNIHNCYPPEAIPTSEWISHLSLHEYFVGHKREEKVVLHAHPQEIISLSHLHEYGEELMKGLYDVLPEMNIYLPDGIALTTYSAPGSDELAQKSLRAISKSRVLVWQYHGLLCCAPSVDLAFDFMEIVTKAAAVYLQLKSVR